MYKKVCKEINEIQGKKKVKKERLDRERKAFFLPNMIIGIRDPLRLLFSQLMQI